MKIGMRWSGLDLFRGSLVTELVRSMISENPGRGFLRAKRTEDFPSLPADSLIGSGAFGAARLIEVD